MDIEAREELARWALTSVNPYTLPEDQHGWRGLGLPGNRKRKIYTPLHNELVLVTVMIQLPGESGARHSHGSDELSIRYEGMMRPIIAWHPAGEPHGGIPYNAGVARAPSAAQEIAELLEEDASPSAASSPEIERLTRKIQALQAQIKQLAEAQEQLMKPPPEPRLLVDILFPPFTTTILDPAYGEPRTVVGQWYD